MKKVAIIGAGITGITTAYYAAKAGYKVTVIEQERYPAMRTSFANGGQISVSNSEVWTTWSNVKKAIKWLFKKDAPLLVRMTPSIPKIKWIVGFLKSTWRGDYRPNTAKTVRLGLKSRELYEEIRQEESIYFDRSACGIMHFYKNQDYWNDAKKITKLYNANGLDRRLIDVDEMALVDPALKDIGNVIGATYTPSDWTGDIHKFCYELAEVLREKYGVEFEFGKSIDSLKPYLKKYDAVVVSAGVGSVKLAESIGDDLPIYPVKGYSITINNVDKQHLPSVSLLDDQAKIVTATLGNKLRVAGTAELNGENYDIVRDRIEPLLKWVETNFPNINTHDYTSWACLRPMTPDMMPIVRQSERDPKVFYNTGHGHLGWTLGPATAKQVIDLIKEEV